MKSFLIGICLVFLIASAECVRWFGTNSDGDSVERVITVRRSPPQNPYTFEVVAAQREVNRRKNVDAIQFLFSTSWVPRFVVRFYEREDDTAAYMLARWSLWKLVEYDNLAGTDGFEPGNDTIVSQYRLWTDAWQPFTYEVIENSDGSKVHYLCGQDSLGVPDVTLCGILTTARTTVNGTVVVVPNAMKWSLQVANYPWTRAGTRLALKVGFDTADSVATLEGDLRDEDTTQGAFSVAVDPDTKRSRDIVASWVNDVDITGTGCPATAPVLRGEVFNGELAADVDVTFPSGDTDNLDISREVQIVYFSIITDCQPSVFSWDPEFGIAAAGSIVPSIAAFFIAIALAFL